MVIKAPRPRLPLHHHPPGRLRRQRPPADRYVRKQGPIPNAPRRVLVIGASTGYGLASRITAAFGGGADTLGIFFEKEGSERKPGSAGWYNSAAFHAEAEAAGLYARSINGDAFSDEVKARAIDEIKAHMGQVDLVVYSLAAPRREHPKTGEVIRLPSSPSARTRAERGQYRQGGHTGIPS